jgi:hypothetical protein
MDVATPRALLLVPGLALVLFGCDHDLIEPTEPVEVLEFEDGVSKDTEGGAFRVVLYARKGLDVGTNELVTRVGFHDPSDPLGPGYGIPGARVHVDVFPIDGEGEAIELDAVYVGDGRYVFEELSLSDPGAWQFEFGIEVGETLDESVAFAFEISE